jgi:DNA-directed RNA polymerase subunit M/transcription elongation factor TFIIS
VTKRADERGHLGHPAFSKSERVVFTINNQIDEHCPKCINDTVYVEKLTSLPIDEGEFYLCRCGKCGWRFRVNAAERFAKTPNLA